MSEITKDMLKNINVSVEIDPKSCVPISEETKQYEKRLKELREELLSESEGGDN
jgi:ABC-type Zn uptake system ZnuABC Zn-binding protein ZnuA